MKRIWENLNKVVFFTALCLSIILLVVSFLMPPTGTIDPSVLTATGELFAFAALAVVIKSIEAGKNISVTKGDVSFSVDEKDESEL